MEEGQGISDTAIYFFTDPESRLLTLGFGVLFAVIFSKIILDLSVFNRTPHDDVTNWEIYEITFEEQLVTFEDELILSDGQTEVVSFEISESQIPDGFLVGEIQVSISYDETNVVLVGDDPCDTVQGSIIFSEIELQWDDDNNTLSGGSNSCEEIQLNIRSYPNYDGLSYEIESYNEVTASIDWTTLGYGIGTFDLQVDLEVQQSQVPTEDDDDSETIQIAVSVVCFDVSVQEIGLTS